VRWYLVGDTGRAEGLDRGNAIPRPETAGGEVVTTASLSSVGSRAA